MSLSLKINGEISLISAKVTNTEGHQVVNTLDWGSFSIYISSTGAISTVVLVNAGSSVTIEWIKLEEGYVTTFFAPNYAEELARCQRYLLSLHQSSTYRAVAVATDYIDFSIPTPTTMRAISGISIINPENFDVRSINPTVSQEGFSYSVITYGANQLRLRATKTAHGLTDATLAVLAVKKVLLSAEL